VKQFNLLNSNRGGKLDLILYPDPILHQICEPVKHFDSTLQDLLDDMLILMKTSKGIGLAAPQVGILKRLFICEIADKNISIMNPTIKNARGETEMEEGCLSLPGIKVSITRKQSIRLSGYDFNGQKIDLAMTDLWARVAQHELDHLNGILICD